MPGVISLRDATPEDADAISALITELAPYFLADPGRPEDAAFFFTTVTPAALRSYLEGDFCYVLAEEDASGTLAGLIGIRGGSHVYHLFVDARFHRRGIARMLWRHVLERGTERFTVNASLFAVPVYEGFGFVADGPVVQRDGVAFQPMVWERECV